MCLLRSVTLHQLDIWWCVIMGLGLCNWRKSGGDVTLFCFQPPRAAGSQPARISPKTPPFPPETTSFYCLSMKVKVLDYCECKRWSWMRMKVQIMVNILPSFPLNHVVLSFNERERWHGAMGWVPSGWMSSSQKGRVSFKLPSRPLILLIFRSSDEKEREKWKIWSLILVKWPRIYPKSKYIVH